MTRSIKSSLPVQLYFPHYKDAKMAINTYQLIFSGNSCGQFVQNVLHLRMDDAGYAAALQAAKGLVDGFLAASREDDWLDMHCESYTLMSLKCRRVSGGIGPEWIDISVTGTNGSRSGVSQSSSNGPVVLLIPLGSPRRVGKIFVSGISLTDADRGQISVAAIAAIDAAATALLQTFTAVGGATPAVNWCIASAANKADTLAIGAMEVCKEIGVVRRRQLPV